MRQAARILLTLAIVAAAIAAGVWVWNDYLYSPWTRNGRVRADIITIAPDVSGMVTELDVTDDESVSAGEALFEIDETRYRAAVEKAQAQRAHEKYAWEKSKHQYQRRLRLRHSGSISAEKLEAARINRDLAKSNYQLAQAELENRQLDLERTSVAAPAAGTVINLDLREGNYVTQSKPVIALVKRDSFYVTGYFAETKIARIHRGQKAKIRLMADNQTLTGRVVRISDAIANDNEKPNKQLVPRVQPTFNWVRLAQRVPVDIELDSLPEDVTLTAGMTASITLAEDDHDASQ